MLDDRVRSVLARMEAQDADDHGKDIPVSERSLAVGPDSGRLLFALVAPNAGCEVLEIGSSHGYSTIWLAAAARILGGRVVTLEQEPGKIDVWRRNIADAGLEEWAELVEGDAKETLSELEDGFDVVFLDAWKDDYEVLFGLARTKLDPGGIVVADNVTTSSTVEAYAAARQADPTLVSVTVPIGHGLEVTTVLQP
ncbi:MAG: class I SAM-dependent methyltransferase [Gaiella sp.]|jgi:predicted O-methyltransferase YrrM|uniref:O-methyltransferase n=1 Tax=Gaiella sp. TaxID=2663207 RepID=UPI003C3FB93A